MRTSLRTNLLLAVLTFAGTVLNALAFALPQNQDSSKASPSPQQTQQPNDQQSLLQRAAQERERHRQAAIEINDLAGRVHSDADALVLVDKIAGLFADILPPGLVTQGVCQRIAHAEYEAVSDPARLIPEQRIVDVWNKYVREIGAPDEALVTVPEIHNMRDAEFATSQSLWLRRGVQTIWTVPNIYSLTAEGKVADGSRPLETVRVLYDLDITFSNLSGARDRVRRGILVSEEIKKLQENPPEKQKTTARLEAHVDNNPIRRAESLYLQQHGPYIMSAVVEKLFDELFPPTE